MPTSNFWLQQRPGYAYLGLGAGWNDGHALFRHAQMALRTTGVRHQALAFGQPDWALPTEVEVEAKMRGCDAVFLVLCLPDNSARHLDETQQLRLVELIRCELAIAKRIRDEVAAAQREQLSTRPGATREKVFLKIPREGSARIAGYCPAARKAMHDVLQSVLASHGKPERFDAASADLSFQIAADLFTHASQITRAAVLLSSTFQGLEQVRDLVRAAVAQLNHRCLKDGGHVQALDFTELQRSTNELEESYRYVDLCTIYLGILGDRMGAPRPRPDGARGALDLLSLTEQEYDYATQHGKQRAFLLRDPEARDLLESPAPVEESTRRAAFEQRIRGDGIPTREFADPEEVRWHTLDLLGWMNRPSVDQQAYPPPPPDEPAYVAHPYVLLDEDTEIVRDAAMATLRTWDSDEASPRLLTIAALGGMGKSALAWRWFRGLPGRRRRLRSMWWSFYARDAGTEQFAAHALWWLQGSSRHAGTCLERNDLAGLMEALLQELAKDRADYVFVLDGIERLFVCYEHFRGEIAVDEGPGLDLRLRDLARSLVDHGAPDEATSLRYLLGFSDAGSDELKGMATGQDTSCLSHFLRRVVALPNVRILLTSRFVPTVVEDLAGATPPTAGVMPLPGLDVSEARRLWERHGLTWEDQTLPEELGGGTLADLCCGTLRGFALPMALLATLVARHTPGRTDFRTWKGDLPEPLRSDPWCVPVSAAEPLAEHLRHMGSVQAKILLRTIHRLRDERNDWTLLQRVLEEPTGIGYADLRLLVGGNAGQFPTERELWSALQRLRSWKILGCSGAMDRYDAHPVMRRALQQHSPEDDPHYQAFLRRRIAAWQAEDIRYEDGALPLERLEPRWQTILDLLDQGGALHAFSLFYDYIETSLRYRTKGAVVTRRAGWLDRAIHVLDDMKRLRWGGLEYEILRGLLQCLRADNLLLQGQVAASRDELMSISEGALRVPPEERGFEFSLLLRARRALTLGHVEAAGNRNGSAIVAFQTCRANALPLFHAKDHRVMAANCIRWSLSGLVHALAAIGQTDNAAALLALLNRFHPAHTDADVAAAALAVAKDRGVGVAAALDDYQVASTASHLNYGNFSARLAKLDAQCDRLIDRASPDGTLAQQASTLVAEAKRDGFLAIANSASLVTLRLRLDASGLAADEVLDALARLALERQQAGDLRTQAAGLAVAAETHLAAGQHGPARACSLQGLRTLLGEGAAYAHRALRQRLHAVLRATGADPDAEEGALLPPSDTTPPSADFRVADWQAAIEPAPPPRSADIDGMSDEAIREQLDLAKQRLDWADTTGSARKWWLSFESENKRNLHTVLRTAIGLVDRQSTITEFFLTWVYSNTDDIQANLHYLDYLRRKKQRDNARQAGKSPQPSPMEGVKQDFLVDGLDQTIGSGIPLELAAATDAEVAAKVASARARLEQVGLEKAPSTWWTQLCDAVPSRSLLQVLLALESRKASIGDLYRVWVYANTEDLAAVFDYLDYHRLKKAAEATARERAQAKADQQTDQARLEATTLASMLLAKFTQSNEPPPQLDAHQRRLLRDHPPVGWSDAESRWLEGLVGEPDPDHNGHQDDD